MGHRTNRQTDKQTQTNGKARYRATSGRTRVANKLNFISQQQVGMFLPGIENKSYIELNYGYLCVGRGTINTSGDLNNLYG